MGKPIESLVFEHGHTGGADHASESLDRTGEQKGGPRHLVPWTARNEPPQHQGGMKILVEHRKAANDLRSFVRSALLLQRVFKPCGDHDSPLLGPFRPDQPDDGYSLARCVA